MWWFSLYLQALVVGCRSVVKAAELLDLAAMACFHSKGPALVEAACSKVTAQAELSVLVD